MEFILAMLLIFVVTKWVEFSDAIRKWWRPGGEYGWSNEWWIFIWGRSYAGQGRPYFRVDWENLIIRNPVSLFLLNKLLFLILRLPYFSRGSAIMEWIIRHTPADPNERK